MTTSQVRPAAVELRDVSIVYGQGRKAVVALDGCNLEIAPGEFVSIIGPSGCGKSSLLRAIADLIPQQFVQGDLQVNGGDAQQARRVNSFAFVFQDPVLVAWRNVLQNVSLPLEVGRRSDNTRRTGSRTPEELLQLVGLSDFAKALPAELSGGMRQRVSLARALTLAPSVLLMDEPFGALDELTRDQMHTELQRVLGATDAAVLLVTHSISEAVFLSDRIVVMSHRPGRIRMIIDVDFPRPRAAELKTTVEFLNTANEVRSGLAVSA